MTTSPETPPLLAAKSREFSARDDTARPTAMPPRLSGRTRRFGYFTFRTSSLAEAWRAAEQIARGRAANPAADDSGRVSLVGASRMSNGDRRAVAAARCRFSPGRSVPATEVIEAYRAVCPEEFDNVGC